MNIVVYACSIGTAFREKAFQTSEIPADPGGMAWLFVFIFLLAAKSTDASPLFEESTDQPLVVEISADLSKITNARSDIHTSANNYLNGGIEIGGRAFDIKLQTRGHNRLATCPFPPLKVYFDKSQVKNTLLKDNHELKIVTHCQEGNLQLLFREHLIYKMYNLTTPYSFHVRLLRVRYVDSGRQAEAIETYAFFIESSKSIRKRLNLDKLKSDDDFNLKTYKGISQTWLNISQTKLLEAFQHLIRHNDWVIYYMEPTRTYFLANIQLFYNDNEGFPFPYDFDLAGTVTWNNTGYEHRFGNDNLCKNVDTINAFKKILSRKEDYLQLLEKDPLLSSDYKNRLSEYLNRFQSADDFCSRMDATSSLFSGAGVSP